jgi:predicted metal-dependent HD superfamily phosphohydrolase
MVSPERLVSMQWAWVRLLEQFSVAPADAFPLFDRLVAAYSAPERHYHNLEHLGEMFRVASRLGTSVDDPAAVQLAIWFHDAVYDTRAKDNEVRSGDLAVELLTPLGLPGELIAKVVELVRATAHLPSTDAEVDRNTEVMLDADLAILGAAEERYRRYASDIRMEYAWVPDAEYRKGRSAVLQLFLDRPRIYRHPLLIEEGEAQARANMKAELEQLAE